MNKKDLREKMGVPFCPYCNKPLVRVFRDGGEVICNACGERLDRSVGSDPKDGTYTKCPYCGEESSALIGAGYNTKCPRCGRYVLRTECNM